MYYTILTFNRLPNNKILDWIKLKAFAFADEKLDAAKIMIGLKTVWKKEKRLITSIFSFFHKFFKRFLSLGC